MRFDQYERGDCGLLLPRDRRQAMPLRTRGPLMMAAPQQMLMSYGGLDPYFGSVTVLMHFDGSDGDTTTTDVKGNTVTRNGTPTLSTTQVKYGTTAGKFNGSQSFECDAGAGLQMGSGDWTAECWIYPTTVGAADFLNTYGGTSATSGFYFQVNGSSGQIEGGMFYSGSSFINTASGAGAVVANAWQHVALTRDGNNLRLYVGGVQQSVNGGMSGKTMNAVSQALNVGAEGAAGTSGGLIGYIDDARITKGVCRYPNGTTFTPSTTAFPNS